MFNMISKTTLYRQNRRYHFHAMQIPAIIAVSIWHSAAKNRNSGQAEYKKGPQGIAVLRTFYRLAATYSPTWYSSTIGTNGLNFSVRYG